MTSTQYLWDNNTIMRPTWLIQELREAKSDHTVSVVIPTLNEEQRVGAVIDSIYPHLGDLIDEIVVIDSQSSDDTVRVAQRAGAQVMQLADIFPHIPVQVGKGESLWRGLAATQGDIVMFMDADLLKPDSLFVPNTIAPLLLNDGFDLSKGFYRRPLADSPTGGGRVTELVARPLLASCCPEASFLVQPLGGEYAIRRKVAERLPFAAGYGVEIGLVMDLVQYRGAEHLCQVNLGVRQHRNRSLAQLGQMAREVSDTVLRRIHIRPSDSSLVQFEQGSVIAESYTYYAMQESHTLSFDRQPLITLDAYRKSRDAITGVKED